MVVNPLSQSPAPRSSADTAELIRALASKDGVERQWARRKLSALGRPAVPALLRCLSDPRRQVRWEAAKALGQVRDGAAAGGLVGALEDKESDVRWVAAAALAAIGQEALPALLAALMRHSDSDWLREGAHHVCHELARTPNGRILRPVLDALSSAEPECTLPTAAQSALWALRGTLPADAAAANR